MNSTDNKISMTFFKDLISDYVKNYSNNHHVSEGYAFGIWYFQILHNLILENVENILVDDKGDNSIDAIYYEEYNRSLTFFQFKNPRLGKSIAIGDVNSFLAGIDDIRQYISQEKDNKTLFNQKLIRRLNYIKELVRDDRINSYKLKLVLGTDELLSNQAKKRIDGYIEKWRYNLAKIQFEFENISDLYKKYINVAYGSLIEKIKIKLISSQNLVYNDNIIQNAKILSGIANGWDLAEIYKEYRESLLMKNIRVGIDVSSVNENMYSTASSNDAKLFAYYNNGITFVTQKITNNIDGTITLYNPQIVNGGQTIRVLTKALENSSLKKDVNVQLRILEITDESLIGNITNNLNNQNPIDILSKVGSNPHALLLKKSLESYGYYLEKRSNEFNQLSDSQKKEISRTINCPIEKLNEKVINLVEGLTSYILLILFNSPIVVNFYSYAQVLPKYIFSNLNEESLNQIYLAIKSKEFIQAYLLFNLLMPLVKKMRKDRYKYSSVINIADLGTLNSFRTLWANNRDAGIITGLIFYCYKEVFNLNLLEYCYNSDINWKGIIDEFVYKFFQYRIGKSFSYNLNQ